MIQQTNNNIFDISKPSDTQILITSEAFKDLHIDQGETLDLNKTGDKMYESTYNPLILGFRKKGFANTKQILIGNTPSLLTLLTSIVDNLVEYNVMKLDDLDIIKQMIKNKKNFK